MTEVAAISIAVILSGLTLFQLALIAGAPLGNFAWGGADRVLPPSKKIGSIASIAMYFVIALAMLERAALITIVNQPEIIHIIAWIIAIYFSIGVLLNGLSTSKPERLTMTPIAFLLAALSFMVILGGQ